MIYRIIIFLMLNFAALAIGGMFTSKGVSSDWYATLDKAPWTPPGWMFGAAWTTIMICFAVYMAYAWPLVENKKLFMGLYIAQWILNVAWNPTFFYYNNAWVALILIIALTILVGFILFLYRPELNINSFFLAPYFVWLIVATSLNAYILLKN